MAVIEFAAAYDDELEAVRARRALGPMKPSAEAAAKVDEGTQWALGACAGCKQPIRGALSDRSAT